MSISVVIAYHSGYGHTARQAQAVASGAASVPGVSTVLRNVAVLVSLGLPPGWLYRTTGDVEDLNARSTWCMEGP